MTYLKWADTNKMVVLFPQTRPHNFNGCWDWFGYTNADYATKKGVQTQAVKFMVDHLSAGKPISSLPAPGGVTASVIDDRRVRITWDSVPGASAYAVYRNGGLVKTTVHPNRDLLDSDLEAGTQYQWTVRALDAQKQESRHSQVATASTTGEKAQCYFASNLEHIRKGRAVPRGLEVFAVGTNKFMGSPAEKDVTSLKTTRIYGQNGFDVAPCF